MKQFTKHTIESAPEPSKELLKRVKKVWNASNLFRYMSGAPAVLKGYFDLSTIFYKTSFSSGEQHLILLASSIVNECSYCTAAHTRAAKANGVPSSILNSIRKQRKLDDTRLQALIDITQKITKTRGHINADDLSDFYQEGFSPENVMEIILGISLKTMSNYINHVTENIINEELQPFAVGQEIEDELFNQ